MTKERVIAFLETTGMTRACFARKCELSEAMLHFYVHGERKLSERSEKRINDFMDNYIDRVAKLARV